MDTATVVTLVIGLLVLSLASGMLGLGVAFAAVPFLGFFLPDLVHQVQPLSLLLNGVTAMFAAAGFARSGFVAWRPALLLTAVAAVGAPMGSWLAQGASPTWLWGLYLAAVGYLAWRMFRPSPETSDARPRLALALVLTLPISVAAGLLGVGPGFLLMPALILAGYAPKVAAAVTAVAVTVPSFTALVPHLGTAEIDVPLAAALLAAGATGSFVGARLTSRFVSGPALRRMFGVLIVVMTTVKVVQVLAG